MRSLKIYVLIGFAFLLTFGILLLIRNGLDNLRGVMKRETTNDSRKTVSEYLMESINGENIKQNLRKLTQEYHLAGTEANKRVSETIEKLWIDAGVENVHTVSYEVLLSYPDFNHPNRLWINNSNLEEVFSTTGMSPVVLPDEQGDKYAGIQWLAYSSPGRISGDVVFVNRGLPSDFEYLKKMGVDIKGTIALMRYGEGFREDKIRAAEVNGAIGAILYSDPADVAKDGLDHVYPSTVWMPQEAVQRGDIKSGYSGDPLSLVYPSKKGMFRSKTVEDIKREGLVPSIPTLPISYSTAYQILRRLNGQPAPVDWQGGINVTYRVGPGFRDNETLTFEVRGTLETREIRNVIGYIKGKEEPDRYVILGNHYDAWVYGSVDPNSGTAILAEVARAMIDTMNKTSWRPARTIMFAAWDAEEYGLIGSTELVEEFADILSQRAVIYINMDCLQGNTSLHVTTVPSLYNATIEVAKRIKNPNKMEQEKERLTLFDTWEQTFPSATWPYLDIPIPGEQSDMAAFQNYVGIPVIDFTFKNATALGGLYPLYHTMYETPFLNEHILDTDGFSIHIATGQYWAELARVFADEVVIPLNSTDLARMMLQEYLPNLNVSINSLNFSVNGTVKEQFTNLAEKAEQFFKKSNRFMENNFSQNYNFKNHNAIKDRFITVERCFINPKGIPGSPQYRHVLYSSSVMAGVYNAIKNFSSAQNNASRRIAEREVAEQLSIVQYSVNCAIVTLKDQI